MLFVILGGIVIYFVINFLVRLPGTILQSKFVKLGVIKGLTLDTISNKVGVPNSISYQENQKICQWMQTGYHIALIFDENDICQGITHEAKV